MTQIPAGIVNVVNEFRYHAAEFVDMMNRLERARALPILDATNRQKIDDAIASGQKLRANIASVAAKIDAAYRGSQQLNGVVTDTLKRVLMITPFAPVVTAAGYGWDVLGALIKSADATIQSWTNNARELTNAINQAQSLQAQGWTPAQINEFVAAQSPAFGISRAVKWLAILAGVLVGGYVAAPYLRRLGK